MSAGQPEGLALVIEHSRRLRDDAVAVQARVGLELDSARQTLRTLETYREEQLSRVRGQAGIAQPTLRLAQQTRFTETLDEAIRLQASRVDEIQTRIEACRAAILRRQQRLKALETIARHRQEAASRRALLRDQHASDERAANQHAQSLRAESST